MVRGALLLLLFAAGCHRKSGDAYKVASLAARGASVCAAMKDGSVRCWGRLGGQMDRSPSVQGLPASTKACRTEDAVCAVAKDGRALCMSGETPDVTDLACGAHGACVVTRGHVRCWDSSGMPRDVAGTAGATSVAIGGGTTCATFGDGSVKCWGEGKRGQLGDGAFEDRAEPALVPRLEAKAICVGGEHACAVLEDQTVACFGSDDDGELGDGRTDASATPRAVTGVVGATAIACGEHHTCARLGDSTVWCWGKNDVHQSALTNAPSVAPTRVVGIYEAAGVAAGDDFTCTLMEDGWVRCFGVNDWGQLGDGTTDIRNVPTPIKL